MFPLKSEVFMSFLFRENRRNGTDRRTGWRSGTFNAAPR